MEVAASTDIPGADWLGHYRRREALWKAGGVAEPVGPQCRRCEIPPVVSPIPIDPLVLGELQRIDPAFEIIYDRFTAEGVGPGCHLYRRISGHGAGRDDLLVFEVSFQTFYRIVKPGRVVTLPWPRGGPQWPNLKHVEIIRASLKTGESDLGRETDRRNRIKAHKAGKIKKALDKDLEIINEIKPYMPVEWGGNGRTPQSPGPLFPQQTKRIISTG